VAPDLEAEASSVQSLVDALSIALGRPVLLDDPSLAPLAFSRQWEVDNVRSESILARGVAPEVREALLAQGIDAAEDIVHTVQDPDLRMEERVCMPVRHEGEVLGYLWLLDPGSQLSEPDFERLRQAAHDLVAPLTRRSAPEVADEAELMAGLRSSDPAGREAAADEARARELLGDDQVVLCLLAGADGEPIEAARQAARRLSVGHAIAATAPEGAALLASLGDPVLRVVSAAEVAAWVRAVAAVEVHVGQSAPAALRNLAQASHQAEIALRVARRRTGPAGAVAWEALGAERLLTQLPADAGADVPERLAHFIREEPALVETLTVFLEAAGDVKATAEALSLHRSGLYYRLRRIQELSGLDLDAGGDRLLAQLAIHLHKETL
jgi:PucR C-terminal helix-turn-helix domain